MATEAVILQEEMKEPEVRSHQSHHRAKGPAIACGRSISHRGHPSRLPYGSLRSALTGPDRDAGKSLHYQAMAGALCKGSTLSTYQRSLILLLTQAGFLMEGSIRFLIEYIKLNQSHAVVCRHKTRTPRTALQR
jgi:hypothetical protein